MPLAVKGMQGTEFPLDQPANFYLVNYDELSILVDAGPNPSPPVTADYVVVTHWHWDHIYGLVSLARRVKGVCISRRTLENIDGSRALDRMKTVALAVFGENAVHGPVVDAAMAIASRYDEVKQALTEANVYDVHECPPLTRLGAEVADCPGHSDDHVCIIIHGHAFVGDNVVHGRSVTLTSPDDYFKSMIRLLSAEWTVAHPGHGPYEIPKSGVASYVSSSLESKMNRLCKICSSIGDEWVPLNIVLRRAYQNIADHPFLAFVAARSLVGYVSSLESRGLIVVDRSRFPWLVRRAGSQTG